MELFRLMDGSTYELIQGTPDTDIAGLAYDSRKVTAGGAFVCVRGFSVDGHDFARDAVARGASALVAERVPDGLPALVAERVPDGLPAPVTVVRVPCTRNALAHMASRFYGQPSERLRLIGITGTRGKTATAALLCGLLDAAGCKTGLIGTRGIRIGGEIRTAERNTRTTPESLELNEILNDMVQAGVTHAVIEVTSHALALDRAACCRFETGVFTNLSPAHLDFHGSMAAYEAAKLKLFAQCRHTAVNVDDAMADRVMAAGRGAVTFGLGADADVRAADVRRENGGASFILRADGADIPVCLRETESFAVYNLLAAVAACRTLDLDARQIARGMARIGLQRGAAI